MSILVDIFISKISLPMQPVPEIGHSLRIVSVIEKLAFHSGPHIFTSGIIVAPANRTVHALVLADFRRLAAKKALAS